MKIDSAQRLEAKLKKLGMPPELPFEQERAAQAGVELVSLDTVNSESEALAEKLRKEDPRNIFSGFPNSLDMMVSLVKTLQEEWVAQNISVKDIHITIHDLCINDNDCVVLSHNSGNRYHYNTKNIPGYSRDKLISKLQAHNLSFSEK